MKTSEQIVEITKALIEAHKNIKHAVKDKKNPYFNSDYATLESVIDQSKKHLIENGIVVIQSISEKTLITRLQHVSGQYFESSMDLFYEKQNMQAAGSAVSYARRYSLAAMLNMSQTDDDGNEASKEQPKETEKKKDNNESISIFAKSIGVDHLSLKQLIIKKYGKPVDFNDASKDDCRLFCEFIKKEKENAV